MLGSASFFDIRKREVNDMLWIFFGMTAAALYVFEFIFGGDTFDLFTTAVPIMIAAAMSFGIYKSGLFGGADALAIVTLAAILPTFNGDIAEKLIPGGSVLLLHPIVPIIVLSNAVILSLSLIVFNLISNGVFALKNPRQLFDGLEHESVTRKIIAVAVGYKTRSTPKFAFTIEQDIDGRRQFSFAPRNAETTEYESKTNVWVTRGTPFLAFMLVGFTAMLFVGDIAAILMTLFL